MSSSRKSLENMTFFVITADEGKASAARFSREPNNFQASLTASETCSKPATLPSTIASLGMAATE